jgi:hypothetical protein
VSTTFHADDIDARNDTLAANRLFAMALAIATDFWL